MEVFNYTKLKKREKRVYKLMDIKFSQDGIATDIIKTSAVMLGIFSIFGFLVCALTNKLWYNPIYFIETSFTGWFYLIFVGGPIGLGIALNKVKVQNYKLIDYLKIYFSPKIPLDQNGKKFKIHKIETNTFIERL